MVQQWFKQILNKYWKLHFLVKIEKILLEIDNVAQINHRESNTLRIEFPLSKIILQRGRLITSNVGRLFPIFI